MVVGIEMLLMVFHRIPLHFWLFESFSKMFILGKAQGPMIYMVFYIYLKIRPIFGGNGVSGIKFTFYSMSIISLVM